MNNSGREETWRRVSRLAGSWEGVLGVADWVCGVLKYEIRDMPTMVEKGREYLGGA